MEIRSCPQRPGGQVFEHPVLDLPQAMVAGVQDRLGLGQVQPVRGDGGPGQAEQEIQIGQPHAVLGRRGIGLFQAFQFALGRFPGVVGQFLGLDARAQLTDVAGGRRRQGALGAFLEKQHGLSVVSLLIELF